MARIQILGLLLAIIGTSVVHSLTTTIKQRIVVGNKKFQCKFMLKHTSTEVNVKGSKLNCFPKKPKIRSFNLKLESVDYFFDGKIKINPSRIQRMSCAKKQKPDQKVVISTNFPFKYPNNEDKEYPITVDEGHVISLMFTDLKIEANDQNLCVFDWVTVVDADGTVLLDKTCGDTQPDKITSNTNSITIKFVSDRSVTRKGFRAEYEAVRTPCQYGWVGPVKGDLGGEMQGKEGCVKVLQNNGNHYKGRDACRQDCLNLGGDLVSIHSDRENGLLLGLMNGGQDVRPAWIGVAVCNDTSGCNKFSWTDGSPVPYENFYSGPPYSQGSCYAMGVPAEGADPETWVAVPCEGVDRYDCVCLEILE